MLLVLKENHQTLNARVYVLRQTVTWNHFFCMLHWMWCLFIPWGCLFEVIWFSVHHTHLLWNKQFRVINKITPLFLRRCTYWPAVLLVPSFPLGARCRLKRKALDSEYILVFQASQLIQMELKLSYSKSQQNTENPNILELGIISLSLTVNELMAWSFITFFN